MDRRLRLWGSSGVSALALLVAAAPVRAEPPALGHAPILAVDALPARPGARLDVASPAFAAGGAIPLENTQYGANRFPGASWSAGPAGTKSYLVVIQGRDAAGGATSLHLVLYDIPADITRLPAGMTQPPPGAVYGENVHGLHAAYAGPHTHTAEPHDYHLQVLALDTTPPSGLDFHQLLQAVSGHVLASGDLVGVAERPSAAAAAQPPDPVRIDTGLLQGVSGRDPSVTVYKGVPYAAPPVGALRWRPPQPAIAWMGVRTADRFGAACPQPGGMMLPAGATMSEDCLTLNVWAPPKGLAPHAVYVWIYGGGFIGGTGASPEFDGEGLAKKGVVVVTFNYRVGALGFLSTPGLSRESSHGSSGDYGLLDDIAVLRWVQRNISAFGGDPSKVTIGGQSAGAGSVGFMAISPLARGLFRAGVQESHARYPRDPELRYLSVSYRRKAEAEAEGEAYAKAHGASTPAELRALPWQEIIKGSDVVDPHVDTGSDGEPPLFRPVIDGWVLPHGYEATYDLGAQNPVAIMAGNNKDETGAVPETAFAALRASKAPPRAGMPQTNVTLGAYVASARRKFGPLADDFLRLYPAHDDQEAALQNNQSSRDDSRVSTWLWGTLWTEHVRQPLWTYAWTHAPPGPSHDSRGAFHGSEIPYAFDSLDVTPRPWTGEDRKIADVVSAYWANLIKTGDPNGSGLPAWPPYAADRPQVMEIGDRFGPIPVATPERIAFWKRFYATQTAW